MKTKKEKGCPIIKLLASILSAYVFVGSVTVTASGAFFVFWPLVLFIGIAAFAAYVFYKSYKATITNSLVVGIIVEAIFITIILSYGLIGRLVDASGAYCNGFFGTVTKCSESIGFSLIGFSAVLILPMFATAVTSLMLSNRIK